MDWETQIEEDAKRKVATKSTGLSIEAKITISVVALVAAAGICVAVASSVGLGYLGAAVYAFITGG